MISFVREEILIQFMVVYKQIFGDDMIENNFWVITKVLVLIDEHFQGRYWSTT